MPERTMYQPAAPAQPQESGDIKEATKCFEQIHSAWWEMEKAEYRTSWSPASPQTRGKYVFTAVNKNGEFWSVEGCDPLAVVAEMRKQLGLPNSC